jgi:cysteine desulfurase
MPYFDHNATAPLLTVAREAWLRAHDEAWYNPSSPYRGGAQVKIRLEAAREKFAILLGDEAERYVFTSGATEGAAIVLAHWARTLPANVRIAVNPTEHAAVLASAVALFGSRIHWLKVDAAGVVDLMGFQACIRGPESGGRVAAVVVMAANNETGVLQPWAKIAELCEQAGLAYLCDASQWLGKLPAGGVGRQGFVIASAHKFGGPKGVGLLKLASQSEGVRGQLGGGQERGQRAGTEDFPGIAAMGAALAEAEQKKVFLETERLAWRVDFERSLVASIPATQIVAADTERLWNTVSLLLPFGENTRWVARLDKRGFQVSTGSACTTGSASPSSVLSALGFDPETARRVVRVSSGWETTAADWRELGAAFASVASELKV